MQYDTEKALYERMQKGEKARDIINDMLLNGIIESPKQAWNTLEKWNNKGIHEYGVILDLGWLVNPEIPYSEIRKEE